MCYWASVCVSVLYINTAGTKMFMLLNSGDQTGEWALGQITDGPPLFSTAGLHYNLGCS